jgi:anti-sigma factor RsiW
VALAAALELDVERLAAVHREWIDTALQRPLIRQPQWSARVAVGGRAFAEGVLGDLAVGARDRHVEPWDGAYVVREPPGGLRRPFGPRNHALSPPEAGAGD